jgi:hypothetical protein
MMVFLSQITAKEIVKKEEDIPLDGTCLRDKASKTKERAAVVSTSQYQRLSFIHMSINESDY